jgi:hypothetical protein
MAKQVPFFLPSSSQDAQKLQMQQMMAQMLMSQQRPQREQTRIVPRESMAASILPALTQAAGMYMQGRALKGQEEIKAKEYAALLEAMKGGGAAQAAQPMQGEQPAAPPGTVAAPSDPGVDGGSQSGMNPYGMDPALAAHAYQLDPAKYMAAILDSKKPTILGRNIESAGFTPEQRSQAYAHALLPKPAEAQDNLGAYQPGDYTPESWAQFVKSKDPMALQRYVTPRQEYSPSFQNVTRTLPDGSTQQGTFDQRTGTYNWIGDVVPAGQKSRVEAAGRAEGEITGTRSAKAPTAYATYQAGVKSLEKAMSATSTGPVAGRIPAMTAKQQVAEGAEATMAPVLKELFRSAGEGTFTDSDQALLMKMVPTRKDHEEARKAKIEMIDEIVRAKLGIGSGSEPAASETSSPVEVGQTTTINGVKVKRVR